LQQQGQRFFSLQLQRPNLIVHSGLGWLTPAEFAQTINPPLPPQIQQPKTAGANSKLDKLGGKVIHILDGPLETCNRNFDVAGITGAV